MPLRLKLLLGVPCAQPWFQVHLRSYCASLIYLNCLKAICSSLVSMAKRYLFNVPIIKTLGGGPMASGWYYLTVLHRCLPKHTSLNRITDKYSCFSRGSSVWVITTTAAFHYNAVLPECAPNTRPARARLGHCISPLTLMEIKSYLNRNLFSGVYGWVF